MEKCAADYAKSSKNAKGLVLDEMVSLAGWSKAHARWALSIARQCKGPAKVAVRKLWCRSYGY